MWLCWKVSGKETGSDICNFIRPFAKSVPDFGSWQIKEFWLGFHIPHGKYIKESGPPDLHKKYITSTCNELLRFDFCKVVKCVTFMSCYRINRFHFQFSKKWQSSRIAKIIIAICNLLSSAKLIVFLLVINSSLL